MTPLVAGELIKVRTTRTALGFAVACLLLVIAGTSLAILAGDPVSLGEKRDAINFGGAIAIILLLFGAVGATGEFRHRTLAPAVLIAPDRIRLLLARLGAYSLTALALGVVLAAVTLALAVPLLGGRPGPDLAGGDYADVLGGGLVATVLATAIGVGVGTVVKNQVGAVIGILVWLTIAESLVALLDEDVYDYLLGPTMDRVAQGGDATLAMGPASLVLLGWTAAAVVAAAAVDRRRDVE